ncbi:MAG: PPC domain-containing protein, partial [Planctomycetia bacterium]
AFEPNETANAAKDVGPGTTQLSLHTLLPPRDEDWFRIVANGPGTITITVKDFVNSQGDIDIGAGLSAANLNNTSEGVGSSETVRFPGVANGTIIFLRVFRGEPREGQLPDQPYTLEILGPATAVTPPGGGTPVPPPGGGTPVPPPGGGTPVPPPSGGVTPPNTRPELDADSLPTIRKGTGGVRVAAIVDEAAGDEDGNQVGLAVVGRTGGRWQFRTTGGWRNLTSASSSNALLLNGRARLRSLDGRGFLRVRAWDGTAGANGGRFNISGSTAFSSESGRLRARGASASAAAAAFALGAAKPKAAPAPLSIGAVDAYLSDSVDLADSLTIEL